MQHKSKLSCSAYALQDANLGGAWVIQSHAKVFRKNECLYWYIPTCNKGLPLHLSLTWHAKIPSRVVTLLYGEAEVKKYYHHAPPVSLEKLIQILSHICGSFYATHFNNNIRKLQLKDWRRFIPSFTRAWVIPSLVWRLKTMYLCVATFQVAPKHLPRHWAPGNKTMNMLKE